MRPFTLHSLSLLAGPAVALLATAAQDPVDSRSQLSVLYLAEPGGSHAARRAGVEEFLSQRFTSAAVVEHGAVDPAAVAAADVVLLDWHYDGDDAAPPLGPREAWDKPCVMLGSAGLRIAMKWEVLGGSG